MSRKLNDFTFSDVNLNDIWNEAYETTIKEFEIMAEKYGNLNTYEIPGNTSLCQLFLTIKPENTTQVNFLRNEKGLDVSYRNTDVFLCSFNDIIGSGKFYNLHKVAMRNIFIEKFTKVLKSYGLKVTARAAI